MSPANLVFKSSMSEPPHARRVIEITVRHISELDEGDKVLEIDPETRVITVRREVDLTEEEKALVQAGVNYGRLHK